MSATLFVIYLILWPNSVFSIAFTDVCRSGKRFFIDVGNSGFLNGTVHPNYVRECSVELITCPSCMISIDFVSFHINKIREKYVLKDSNCRCNYLWVSEPPYNEKSGTAFCDGHSSYKSKTRFVSITYFGSIENRTTSYFALRYSAEINKVLLTANKLKPGILSSPFFPSFYPRDYTSEFLITCTDNLSNHSQCRIQLSFTDFHLSSMSFLKFYDPMAAQTTKVIQGDLFRPPIITSTGQNLSLYFYANRGTGLGFKATYSFISENSTMETNVADTNCGGLVEEFGGAITMMNMSEQNKKLYDCVWIIRPPENFMLLKTHLYLKVTSFDDFDESMDLKIRLGLTSESPILEELNSFSFMTLRKSLEHILPIQDGFYISLKGNFYPTSKLVIVYTAFNKKKCYGGFDFLCENHRCIPGKFVCDKLDHCGDGSDESSICFSGWNHEEKFLYSHISNYFFPKSDKISDIKTAALVFLISTLGLIVFVSGLVLFLYRVNRRARQQRELRNHLQTISDMLDNSSRLEEIPVDDPPVYEPPPDYSDAVKSSLLNKTTRRRGCRLEQSIRRSRSMPREVSRLSQLGIPLLSSDVLPSDQQTSSPPPPYSLTPPNELIGFENSRISNRYSGSRRAVHQRSKSCTEINLSRLKAVVGTRSSSNPLSPKLFPTAAYCRPINWEEFDQQFPASGSSAPTARPSYVMPGGGKKAVFPPLNLHDHDPGVRVGEQERKKHLAKGKSIEQKESPEKEKSDKKMKSDLQKTPTKEQKDHQKQEQQRLKIEQKAQQKIEKEQQKLEQKMEKEQQKLEKEQQKLEKEQQKLEKEQQKSSRNCFKGQTGSGIGSPTLKSQKSVDVAYLKQQKSVDTPRPRNSVDLHYTRDLLSIDSASSTSLSKIAKPLKK